MTRAEATIRLQGLRVLLVEDAELVAMYVESMLYEVGCAAVHVAGNIPDALAIIQFRDVDAAVLDVNLDGIQVFQVAAELRRRGLPFLFATGYSEGYEPAEFNGIPKLLKPFDAAALWEALALIRQPHPAPGNR